MYTLKGTNIGLRRLDANDISDNMLEWFKDEQLMQYYTNSRVNITKEMLLESISKGEIEKNNFTYGIFHLETSLLIGTLRLGPINVKHRISDMAILIGNKDFHGQGLAVQAILLGNRVAFETHNLRKLFGGMFASNITSIKAYLRAGWIVEGIRKAHYYNDGKDEDRIEVACFNPSLFNEQFIASASILNLEEILDRYQQ